MQFEPATFSRYALPVPPGGENPPSPYDPTDAVYAAARMLCADGAGNPSLLAAALYDYNHSEAYVAQVLSVAGSLGQAAPDAAAGQVAGQGAAGQVALDYALAQVGTPYRTGRGAVSLRHRRHSRGADLRSSKDLAVRTTGPAYPSSGFSGLRFRLVRETPVHRRSGDK